MVIGYPIFWLELYIFKVGHGKTTPLAWAIIGLFAFIMFSKNYPYLTASMRNFRIWFSQEPFLTKLLLVFMGIASGTIILCAFYASLLPPHLVQEFDALNYHITLPRQHLLLRSFGHIPWSTADLFYLPIDFALAPFWLATSLPNKSPQFFFILGLLCVCGRLTWHFSNGKIWPPLLVILAVLGSHNIGIQLGTAMLDVTICYLFLAALDSFISGNIWLGAIELSFYVWSKPLIPVQFILTLAIFGLLKLALRILGIRKNIWAVTGGKINKLADNSRYTLTKAIRLFFIISLIVAGPFILKSLRYSGTPIFPLGVGMFKTLSVPQSSENWAELRLKAKQILSVKDQYGSGRNLLEFARHFWLIAVPEKGVNNRYDYPLGLMYLLFLGPFLVSLFSFLRQKTLPLISLWIIISWVIWWLGSQQTRFLYLPLILMYLTVALSIRIPSRILLTVMLVGILLVSASVFRANKQDLGKWGEGVLRQQDMELIQLGKNSQPVNKLFLSFYDIAYATFPAEVTDNNSAFVLKMPHRLNK